MNNHINIKQQFIKILSHPVVLVVLLNGILISPSWVFRAADTSHLFSFWYEREIFTLFWLSADLLFLVTLMYITRFKPWHHRVRNAAMTIYLLLLTFEIYAAVIQQLFHRPPVLYNDLFLLVDALYLILNFGIGSWIISLLMLAVLGGLFFYVIPMMFNRLGASFRQDQFRSVILRVGIILWIGTLLVQVDWGLHKRDGAAQLVSYRLGKSVRTSLQYYTIMKSTDLAVLEERYTQFAERRWSSKPNVYFLILESYGKVLMQRPDFREIYLDMISGFADSLQFHGWHGATNYSEAPVNGGGSWLSTATLLTGLRIANEPLYHKFKEAEMPNMVQVFKRHGYRTFYLGPANRGRPGIPLANPYGFDTQVQFNELKYHGYHYGWGIIPDQYSLYFTEENYLKPTPEPVMLYFTSLATHTMWLDDAIPPIKSDWRDLNKTKEAPSSGENLLKHLEIRANEALLQPYKPENFLRLLHYDLEIFRRYITREIPKNSVVIIVGDHQPPLVTNSAHGLQTIIHIISKDQDFVRQFSRDGFTPGFLKPVDAGETITHEEIYPILMEHLSVGTVEE